MIIKIIKKEKVFLLLLFFITFFVRAMVFYCYLSKDRRYWQVDSNTYHQIAKNIIQGDGFSAGKGPCFYRLPGYPLFLAFYYKLFNVDTKNVLWLQLFLASFIPILIFLLSFILFSQIIFSKIVSLYSCFHLGLVLYSSFFMTESLFIFFLLLFAILFFTHNFFLAGIFLGFASLIRPVGHYILIIFVPIIYLFYKRYCESRRVWSLISGWLIIVLPWLLRNYLLLGQIFFHTLPGGHFLYFSAARVVMYPKNYSYNQSVNVLRKKVYSFVKKKEKKLKRSLNEIEWCKIRENLAIKVFKQYPLISLRCWIKDIFKTSFSLYSSYLLMLDQQKENMGSFEKGSSIWLSVKKYLFPKTKNLFLKFIIYLEIFLSLIIWLGLILGLYFAIFNFLKFGENQNFYIYFKVLPFILVFLVIGLSGGFNRIRLPAEPFLMILSIYFWFNFVKKNVCSTIK